LRDKFFTAYAWCSAFNFLGDLPYRLWLFWDWLFLTIKFLPIDLLLKCDADYQNRTHNYGCGKIHPVKNKSKTNYWNRDQPDELKVVPPFQFYFLEKLPRVLKVLYNFVYDPTNFFALKLPSAPGTVIVAMLDASDGLDVLTIAIRAMDYNGGPVPVFNRICVQSG
jgi:hypothetical protein